MKIFSPISLAIILLAIAVSRAIEIPVICMSAPIVPLSPGLPVTASLDPQGKRCEAILRFSDPDFLPVRFEFEPVNNCLGYQEAEFTVPEEVPNGDAFILWRCADQMSPTCTKAMITGGSEDADGIDFNQSGTIGCIIPVGTQTTLSTVVEWSTTFTETATSTIFSTSVGSNTAIPVATQTLVSTVSELSTTFVETATSTIFSTSVGPNTGIPVATHTLVSTVREPSTTSVETATSTIFSTSVGPNTGIPITTQTLVSTVSEPSTTFTETATSTILSTSAVGADTLPASMISEVATLTSTSIDGTSTAVSTFATTIMNSGAPLVTPMSILTSFLTLTITAPCTM